MSDLLATALTIGTVFIFLIIAESLARLDRISKENARKIIHISVGNVIFFVPLFDTRWLAAAIPAIFVFGNYMLSPMSPIPALRLRTFKAGHAWGTIFYPISLAASVWLFFDQPWILVAVFFPVVYGDGFAAVIGPRASSGVFTIGKNTKSLLGTAVVSLFSWGSTTIAILILGFSLQLAILTGVVVAILSPWIELLSPRGTDNLVLPAVLSVVFLTISDLLLETAPEVNTTLFGIGLIFGLIFAIGGYLTKVLTIDGAITGFLITIMMLGLGGVAIGTQLFLFFILGSGATKLVQKVAKSTQDEFEKGGTRRDAIQAVAKAGIPAVLSVLMVFGSPEALFYMISGIMAAALIDTMATEIGIATKGTPVHILTPWKKAEPGQTGVISLKGTLGGVVFGLVFGLTVVIALQVELGPLVMVNVPIYLTSVVLGGTLGMLTDSLLGTTLQRHNQCQECGKIVEADKHHDQPTKQVKGISWFNNDITNILGSLSGGIYCLLLFVILT